MNLLGFNISRVKAGGDALQSTLQNTIATMPNAQYRSLMEGYESMLKHGLFSNPAVAACVATYGMTLSEAPLVAVNDKDEYLYDDPFTMLFSRPNAVMSGELLWSYVGTYIALSGNAYLYKLRNGRGQVAEIHVFNDSQVTPIAGKNIAEPIVGYRYSFNNQTITLPTSDVIQLRGHLNDPRNVLKALSPIQVIARSIDASNALDEIIYSTLRNHATPNTIVSVKEELLPEQAAQIRSAWNEKFGIKRGQPLTRDTVAFLPVEMDVKKIGMNFDELETDKLWGKFETAVCNAYRIDPIVAGVYSSGQNKTYSNYAEAMRGYTSQTRIPIWNRWEEQIEHGMKNEFAISHCEFDIRYIQALQPTMDEKQTTAIVAFDSGIITRNEARTMIGLDVTDNGDVYKEPTTAQPALPAAKSYKEPDGGDITTSNIADKVEGMTETDATIRWKGYDNLYEKHGERIAKSFSKVAAKLETAVVSHYKRAGEVSVKSPFDWNAWYDKFEKGTEQEREALIIEIMSAAWIDTGLSGTLDSDAYNAIVTESISTSASMITDSIGTIKDELTQLLKDNPELTGDELANVIRAKFEIIKSSRADAIGRTTATATAEGAKKDVWKKANERITDPKKKIVRVWLSTRDGKTRSAHLAADGQAEDENEMFTLNGHKTPYPAGSGLPAADAVNCRCTTISVRRERLKK